MFPGTAFAQSAAAPRIPARVTQIVDEGNLTTLGANVHRLARPEFDRGAVDDSQPANRMIILLKRSPEQETALRQLLDQQQDKTSANYHAWLTPDQFGKQFGPADSDVQAVTDWLTSRGFTGIKVGAGRTTIEFSGNIGQVRNAFHTEIHHFLVNGKAHMASVSDPQIPAALAPVIAGVLPLHDFRPKSHAHSLGTFRRTKATGEVKPLFTFNGCGANGANPCYAVGPGDFAKIYNLPSGLDGTGVTIAIVQDSNLNVADVQAYRSIFGLPANFTTSNVILNGPDPGIQGPSSASDDEIEADLDAQLSGGVAPGATINVVVSEDSQSVGVAGIDLSAIYIIDNNFAPILSESFGACEPSLTAAGLQFYDTLWQQASAQGITVILSSGDSGSDSCDQGNGDFGTTGLSVSGLASTPFNIAIGGTDFQNGVNPSPFWNAASSTTTSAKGYVPESTWNDSCAATAAVGNLGTCTAAIVNGNAGNSSTNGIDLAAGGGGPSTITSSGTTLVNPKPAWQSGTTGNPADGARDVPDLSFFAGDGFNGSFYIICQMDANSGTGSSTSSCDLNSSSNFNDFQGVGGTSAGAPAFAGIMALINQKTSQRQGNPNYVLYQLYKKNTAGTICPSAASPAATCIFYDTTSGNNSVACKGGTPNCSNTSTAANQYGVFVVDPTKPTTTAPAWTAGTGYDLATGLGSVNVANLITAWSTASFTADTVAITSPTTAQTIAHGASQPFTVKVTSGSGTPTGQVALIATPSTGSPVTIGGYSDTGPFTLSGGTVTFSTSQLPGGTSYPVVASYGGDGTFAAGKSSAVTFTVTPENSKTVVSLVTQDSNGKVVNSNATTAAYGSPYVLQTAVQDNAGNQCAKTATTCPTGTVTLTDNGAPLNDFSGGNTPKLNTIGIAEDQFAQLAVGSHSLVAKYSGDNSFNASTSAADAISITTASTTISVTPSASTVAVGQSITLTATIGTQSNGVGPNGTVIFSAGSTSLGAANVVPVNATPRNSATPAFASGTATLANVSFAAAGAQSITATYNSTDGIYLGAGPSTAVTVTVTPAGSQATTTTLTASATSIASGGSVTLIAKVTGTTNNVAGPTGTVQFMNGTSPLGTAATCMATAGTSTTPGTCKATLTTTLSSLGPNSITGVYSGDPTYKTSSSVALVVDVTSATSTVVTSSTTSIASGGSVTLTAKVTGTTNNGAGPTGTVQFMNGTVALGTAATCTPAAGTSTTPGTCTATLMTTLSMLTPLAPPRATPNWPAKPMWIVATLLLAVFLLILRRLPRSQRLGYASVGLLLFACVAAGIAGCGGGSSSSTPMSHTDSITAVYSGDTAYSGSTSAAVSVTVQ